MRAYYEAHKDRYSSEGVMQLRDLVAGTEATQPAGAARAAAARHRRPCAAASRSRRCIARSSQRSGRFIEAGQVDTGDLFQFAVRAKTDDATYRAALALEGGEISDPIPLADGVHLIVMIAHRFPVAQTFEQAADRVWSDLKKEAQDRVVAANIAYLRSRADILVAPEENGR